MDEKHCRFLYTVDNTSDTLGGIALRPGISSSQVAAPSVGSMQHGTALELRMPSGQCENATIADYFIECPANMDMNDRQMLLDLPIILVVAQTERHKCITKGTEVWLVGTL